MGPVEKLISKAKEMNFKLLLAFALLALAVAEAQKNGKQPKGPKGGGNGSKGGKGSKGPKGPGGNGGNGGSGGNGKGPKGPGGNSGEDSGEVPPPGPVGPDSEIALCTGSCTCESGDTSKGFTTYGFVKDGVQRCFTVFHPLERAGESLPVVISSQCYGKDKLQSISMKNENAADNKAAARYGYARIGVSTPDGHWTFGNNNIVNDLKPMPCADEDSKDIAYMEKSWISLLQIHNNLTPIESILKDFHKTPCFLPILHFAFLTMFLESGKVAAEWPLLESPRICQDVKDKLPHLILQIIVKTVMLALHPILALNANIGQFIPVIHQIVQW